MREIKFRGLNHNNEWEYGYIVNKQFRAYDRDNFSACDNTEFLEYKNIKNNIISYGYEIHREHHQSSIWVKKNSIGQYTGFKDKNGKEIYEDDILENIQGFIGIVKYDNIYGFEIYNSVIKIRILPAENKIIGNRHENPELLK